MKKLIAILLCFTILGEISYADEQGTYLDQDQKAPYSGYLIKDERVRELLRSERESTTYKLLTESYEKSINLQQTIIEKKDEQIVILTDQTDKLYKTARDASGITFWEKALYFSLGALVVYGSFQLAKGAIK